MMREPTRYAHALGATTRAPAVAHADGTLETVSTHTVALQLTCWALLRDLDGGFELDLDRVLQCALVHDLAEAHTGDEDTFGATDEDRAAKSARDATAVARVRADLPFLASRLAQYEAQDTPEAIFVRCVDKMMPKISRALAGRRLATQAEVAWCYAQMDRETSPLVRWAIYEPLRRVWLDAIDAIYPEEAPVAKRLALAHPRDMLAHWQVVPTDPHASPAEIRRELAQRWEEAEKPVFLVTRNRTVLDQVGPGRLIAYDQVWVFDDSTQRLVRLLDVLDGDYMAHFNLGDLHERGELR